MKAMSERNERNSNISCNFKNLVKKCDSADCAATATTAESNSSAISANHVTQDDARWMSSPASTPSTIGACTEGESTKRYRSVYRVSAVMKRGNSWPYRWVQRTIMMQNGTMMYFARGWYCNSSSPRGYKMMNVNTFCGIINSPFDDRSHCVVVFDTPQRDAIRENVAEKSFNETVLATFEAVEGTKWIFSCETLEDANAWVACIEEARELCGLLDRHKLISLKDHHQSLELARLSLEPARKQISTLNAKIDYLRTLELALCELFDIPSNVMQRCTSNTQCLATVAAAVASAATARQSLEASKETNQEINEQLLTRCSSSILLGLNQLKYAAKKTSYITTQCSNEGQMPSRNGESPRLDDNSSDVVNNSGSRGPESSDISAGHNSSAHLSQSQRNGIFLQRKPPTCKIISMSTGSTDDEQLPCSTSRRRGNKKAASYYNTPKHQTDESKNSCKPLCPNPVSSMQQTGSELSIERGGLTETVNNRRRARQPTEKRERRRHGNPVIHRYRGRPVEQDLLLTQTSDPRRDPSVWLESSSGVNIDTTCSSSGDDQDIMTSGERLNV